MAVHVTLPEVQQWLEPTKSTLATVDTELEDTAFQIVSSNLAQSYSVATWIDANSTPKLVRKVIALLIAAWEYGRLFSQNDGFGEYPDRLEAMAFAILQNIVDGTADLTDVPGDPVEASGPLFYPTNNSSASEVIDSLGYTVGVAGSEDIKFRMGSIL